MEDNKMIALFMGLQKSSVQIRCTTTGKLSNGGHVWLVYGVEEYKNSFSDEQLKYQHSWDWLMPVVEKIENTQECLCFTIESNEATVETWENCDYQYNEDGMSKTKIESTYKAVVSFIKWRNAK